MFLLLLYVNIVTPWDNSEQVYCTCLFVVVVTGTMNAFVIPVIRGLQSQRWKSTVIYSVKHVKEPDFNPGCSYLWPRYTRYTDDQLVQIEAWKFCCCVCTVLVQNYFCFCPGDCIRKLTVTCRRNLNYGCFRY